MMMPQEVAREVTSSNALSGPESRNSRAPWPTTTGATLVFVYALIVWNAVHSVLGQAARLDGGEVALQFRGRELIESPDGPLQEVAVDMLRIPIDRLRASTEHLQVKQPITIQRFKRRLTVAVRGRRDVVNTFRTCGIDRSG